MQEETAPRMKMIVDRADANGEPNRFWPWRKNAERKLTELPCTWLYRVDLYNIFNRSWVESLS